MSTTLAALGQRKILEALTPNWDYLPEGAYNLPGRFFPRNFTNPTERLMVDGLDGLRSLPNTMLMHDIGILSGPKSSAYGSMGWLGRVPITKTNLEDLNKYNKEINTIADNFERKYPRVNPENIHIVNDPMVAIDDVSQRMGRDMRTSMHPVHIAANLDQYRRMTLDGKPSPTPQIIAGVSKGLNNAAKWLIPGAMMTHGWLASENPELKDSWAYNMLTKYGPETFAATALAAEVPNALRYSNAMKLLSPEARAIHAPHVGNMIKKNLGKLGLGYGALALARHFLVDKPDEEIEKKSSPMETLEAMALPALKVAPTAITGLIVGMILNNIYNKAKIPPQVQATGFGSTLANSSPYQTMMRTMAFGSPEVNA